MLPPLVFYGGRATSTPAHVTGTLSGHRFGTGLSPLARRVRALFFSEFENTRATIEIQLFLACLFL